MSTATLNPALVTVIEQIVDEKVNRCDMFTAFDVSVEVKNRGHNERHGNMKHVVHDLYVAGRMPDYNRTLIDIPGVSEQAWCYHHQNYDPTQYQPMQRQGGKAVLPLPNLPTSNITPTDFYNQSPAPAQVTDGTDPSAVANTNPAPLISMPGQATASPVLPSVIPPQAASNTPTQRGKGTPDARGTLCVPADMIRNLNVQPRSKVYVVPDAANQQVILFRNKTDADQAVTTASDVHDYTVDDNANVRITKVVLDQAIPQTTKYSFDNGQNDRIIIK